MVRGFPELNSKTGPVNQNGEKGSGVPGVRKGLACEHAGEVGEGGRRALRITPGRRGVARVARSRGEGR